jgi:hypothetical protein
MSIRIPKNIIVESKYTSGKEYMVVSTYKEYQGYYYELNNKIFAGKEFDINAPELQKIEVSKLNPFLIKASTYVYGLLSNSKINSSKPISKTYNPTPEELNKGFIVRYFSKKLNENPIIIKEINESSFKELKQNPIYQVISINWNTLSDNEIVKISAEKEMPGIKAFLEA